MDCSCGKATGTHTDNVVDPDSGLCLQCFQAGCDPDDLETGCIALGGAERLANHLELERHQAKLDEHVRRRHPALFTKYFPPDLD